MEGLGLKQQVRGHGVQGPQPQPHVQLHPKGKEGHAFAYFIAGATAGVVSRTCTAPLDRLKILLQTQQSEKYTGVIQGLKKINVDEGITGFWRGNGANVYKIIPEAGIRFCAWEVYQATLFDKSPGQNLLPWQKFVAGGLAGATSQIVIYPMEVIRSRLAVAPPGMYHGVIDTARRTLMHEGWRALYRGLPPALLGIIPYAAIDLTIYDTLKNMYITTMNLEPGVLPLLCCGAISGTTGQLAAYPLDLVRRRLQVQGMHKEAIKYTGAIDVLKKTVEHEGLLGLYKGLVPSILKVVPTVGISYVVYETMKKQLHI